MASASEAQLFRQGRVKYLPWRIHGETGQGSRVNPLDEESTKQLREDRLGSSVQRQKYY